MAKTAAILGVHLLHQGKAVRVGTLTRSAAGETAFIVEEAYLRGMGRPILSLSWLEPASEQGTMERLAYRGDKIGILALCHTGSPAYCLKAPCTIFYYTKWAQAIMTSSISSRGSVRIYQARC